MVNLLHFRPCKLPWHNEINAGNCSGNKYAIRHLVCNYWNFNWTPFIFKYIENKCKLTFYYIYGAANCTSMKEINLVPGILLSGILVSGILASSIFGIRHWFEPYSKTLNLNHFSSTHIPFVYDLKRRGFIYYYKILYGPKIFAAFSSIQHLLSSIFNIQHF